MSSLEVLAETLHSFSNLVHINDLIEVTVSAASLFQERCHGVVAAILADELGRGMVNLSNLEQNVLLVMALALTLLAEVVVIALSTLVPDAFDVSGLANVTNDILVLLLSLLVATLMLLEDILKTTVTELLNLVLDHLHLGFKTGSVKEAMVVASGALGTLADMALHLRFKSSWLSFRFGLVNLLGLGVNKVENLGHFGHFEEIGNHFGDFFSSHHGIIHSSCHIDGGAGNKFRHSIREHSLHAFDHADNLVLLLGLHHLWLLRLLGLLTRS